MTLVIHNTASWVRFLMAAPVIVLSLAPASQSQSSRVFPSSAGSRVTGLRVVGTDYKNIQDAIDDAEKRGGGAVLLPSGRYVAKQIILRSGVSLIGIGMNPPPHGQGTILQQEAGANCDFVVSDTTLPATEYLHWSIISNLQIVGNPQNTRGSGIRLNSRTGEGLKLEHLFVKNFAESGITLARGAVPFYGEDLHLFHNGSYGIDISRTDYDINQLVKLSLISGDDNGVALVHIGPSGGLDNGESYEIDGVKAEKHTRGRQNDVILLTNMNGSPVVITAVGATNTSGEKADAIVRVTGSSARLYYTGLSHDRGYTYSINDEVAHRQLARSPAGFYGADMFPEGAAPDKKSAPPTQRLRQRRAPACATVGGAACETRVMWDPPFADRNYTATCSLESSGSAQRTLEISRRDAGSMIVSIRGDSSPAATDILNCISIHD